MSVRPYRPADLEAVMTVIQAAAREDHTRLLSAETFLSSWKLHVPDPEHIRYDESAVVTLADGTVAGFAWWAVSAQHTITLEGWVYPAYRRRKAGTALLNAVEDYAAAYCSGKVIITARGFADIPGLAALFQQHGYTHVRTFNTMSTRLQGKTFRSDLPPGVTLRAFERSSLDMLVDVDNTIFRDHWGAKQRTTPVWEHDMIRSRPHDPALWVLAWADEQIVGECLCHANHLGDPNDGWISIIGVLRDYRGQGLGRVLLANGLQRLQDKGFDTASLNVDADNRAAINLYRSLGLDITRQRLHFSKTIYA
jgi:mycothiol synthase